MSITWNQAEDLLCENYGYWFQDDPEWWLDMVEALMKYPSVKALRHANDNFGGPWWQIPKSWPGATPDAPPADRVP